MSTIHLSQSLANRSVAREATVESAAHMNWGERILLGIGVFEIPLQIDKYFMFHETDAALGAVGGFNVSVLSMCLAGLYLLWVLRYADPTYRRDPRDKMVLGVPMLIYLGVVGLSVTVAGLKLLALFDLFLLGQSFLLFFYVANRVRHRDDLKFVIFTLCITGLFQSFLIFGLKALGESAYGQQFDLGPLALTVWEDGRPAGSMHSAVLVGSFLALLWVPATAILLTNANGNLRRLALITTGAVGLAILITQTRGAILTTFLSACILGTACLMRGWLPKNVLLLAVVVALVGIIPLKNVVEKRLQGNDNGSAEARLHLASIASEMIADQPWFGFGAGNCHVAGSRYADQAKYRSLWYYTVHCKYLLVWIETGVIGLLAFLLVLSNGLIQGLRTWFLKDRFLAPIGLALAVAIFGNMLHMVVDVFNSRTQVQVLWLILGLAAAVSAIAEREQKDRKEAIDVG